MRGNKEIQICSGLISRLSEEVAFEILVRISSAKTVALCKCVCKSWRALISDPRFAELHLARSKICVLVRNTAVKRTLRTVYLLEDEDGRRGFHSGHCICRMESCDTELSMSCISGTGTETESCEICHSDTTAITKLKIPVGPRLAGIIQNTCNGFLCLYSYNDSSIAVCNPATGEFVTLPDLDRRVMFRGCGLALDPKTGRYKVVVLYSVLIPNSEFLTVLKALVHVLGTDSWRELDAPDVTICLMTQLSGPTLLDGALCWVYRELSGDPYKMVSFDLESERLRYPSLPSFPLRNHSPSDVAVLRGRLCVYSSNPFRKLVMCVMDKPFVSDSSSEWISHDLSEVQHSLKLLCSLDDGALLMFNGHPDNELVYYDPPRGSLRFKRLSFAGRGVLEVVAFTPSFLSLKDIVRPGNAEVLNVYSRIENPVGDEDASV